MAIDVETENIFLNKWDLIMTQYIATEEALKMSLSSLQSARDNLQDVLALFKKLWTSTRLIPESMEISEKVELMGFFVRTTAACIMVNLDDISFNINGRILSEVRKQEVAPSDISKSRTGYHHEDFRDDAVLLSNCCMDGLRASRKGLKTQLRAEWSAIEVYFLPILSLLL
jgi:hypothetical protein